MSRMSVKTQHRSIAIWLFVMILLVTAIIVIGGATRLTNSGLSITEWAPIRGALPPLSEAQWIAEFEKYKKIPEFTAEHPDMDLAGFKFIYFWEWSHRQLGRLVGVIYALPFFYFLLKRKVPKESKLGYLAVLLLIGLQGAIGWWMVHSGLQEGMVSVSQYRLAIHLGMAFLILGILFWLFRGQIERPRSSLSFTGETSLYSPLAALTVGLVYLQVLAGAFVAGTQSGKTYNSWPLMDGKFVPEGYGMMSPFWRNIFENTAAIQFNHRTLAYIILATLVCLWVSAVRQKARIGALIVFTALLIWQVCLGIWTLLSVAPLNLSLLHQFSSVLVFLCALWVWRSSRNVTVL
ncbi:COX15/CtaA family protein [Litorimonas sp.]|uniref:COX15/CtaA family protein n=1 Tax=Litorimonas sp. TaxID=1892381 RepID=UPI003A89E6BA